MLLRETPVGYALLKAKSSKILKKDNFKPEDDTAENICSLYVAEQPPLPNFAYHQLHMAPSLTSGLEQLEIEAVPGL